MPFCISLIASILGPFKKDLFMPLLNKKKAGRKKKKQKVINLVNGSGIPTGARQQSKQQKRR